MSYKVKKLLEDLDLHFWNVPKDGKYVELTTVSVNDGFGLLNSIITQATLKVFGSVTQDDKCRYLILDYSWDYPTGSNGYAVTFRSQDQGESWEVF